MEQSRGGRSSARSSEVRPHSFSGGRTTGTDRTNGGSERARGREGACAARRASGASFSRSPVSREGKGERLNGMLGLSLNAM